ncbi:hypothetical protein KaCgl_14830 [Corynebacterium glutamicum]|nr:hypothetical protein KaCgl_14830 [Corynebacterium glutamicum]
MIIGIKSADTAQITDPRMNGTSEMSIIFFLLYISASLPITGVATAPTSSVTVMIQEALAAVVLKISGNRPMIGITRVCARETVIPAEARVPTSRPYLICGVADSGGPDDIMCMVHILCMMQ